MRLADSELLALNGLGFIPGPEEGEEAFLRRVHLIKAAGVGGIPRAHWDWVRAHLKELFDFEPHSLPAFYSNAGLVPWQGAATWIEEGQPPRVQLREGFRKGSYFGYSRSEILAHEAVHAARSAFEEPMAEEFFAYMASEKSWRRVFGPIVKRPWEVWFFFLLAVLGIAFPLAQAAASFWLGCGAWRLFRLHRTIGLAAKRLKNVSGDRKKIRALLLRLTDREIRLFADGENPGSYARSQECLRWRLIRLAYFDKMGAEVNHGSKDRR